MAADGKCTVTLVSTGRPEEEEGALPGSFDARVLCGTGHGGNTVGHGFDEAPGVKTVTVRLAAGAASAPVPFLRVRGIADIASAACTWTPPEAAGLRLVKSAREVAPGLTELEVPLAPDLRGCRSLFLAYLDCYTVLELRRADGGDGADAPATEVTFVFELVERATPVGLERVLAGLVDLD
jgi:hypothetical protein